MEPLERSRGCGWYGGQGAAPQFLRGRTEAQEQHREKQAREANADSRVHFSGRYLGHRSHRSLLEAEEGVASLR